MCVATMLVPVRLSAFCPLITPVILLVVTWAKDCPTANINVSKYNNLLSINDDFLCVNFSSAKKVYKEISPLIQ
jgi:hypothetical protein